jgi:hypothetical protein
MSPMTRDEFLWRFAETEDPEVEARERHILEVLLEANPQVGQQFRLEGPLAEARAALRRVIARRQFSLSPGG